MYKNYVIFYKEVRNSYTLMNTIYKYIYIQITQILILDC